jgi:predicted  nucleic acid-binding Zn-ribbon protein
MDPLGNELLVGGTRPGAAERMRELLARTIQDHASDERSTVAALEEIVQRLENLELAVREVRELEVPGLGASLEGLAARVDDARDRSPGWAESMAGRIEWLGGQIAPADGLAAVHSDVTSVAGIVEQILPQLKVVCDTVAHVVDELHGSDERLVGLTKEVGRLRQSMDAAGSRFSRLDKSVAELTQRMGQLDKELSVIKGRTEQGFDTLGVKVGQAAEELSGQLTTQGTAITGLSTGLTNLGTRAEKISDQVQTVHDQVDQLDDRIGDAEDRLSVIQNTVTVTENNVTTLNGNLAEQGRNLAALGSQVAGLSGKFDGLDGRLEGVGARLDGLADKFVAVDGRFEAVAGRFTGIDGRLSGLAEQIASVASRIDAVDHLLDDLPGSSDLDKTRDKIAELTAGAVADLDTRITELGGKLGDLASRPDRKEIASIVEAAAAGLAMRLSSLEDTVLTLAEALLRPAAAAARAVAASASRPAVAQPAPPAERPSSSAKSKR